MALDLGLEPERGLPWVLALAALHDLGKASPAFQVKWPEGRKQLHKSLKFAATFSAPYVPHGVITEVLLPELLVSLGWPLELSQQVAVAVGSHHGARAEPQELARASDHQIGGAEWEAVRRELFELVLKAVGADRAAVPEAASLSGAAFMRLAGLTSFADWLGSSFPLPSAPDFSAYERPAAYFAGARERARQKLVEEVHWPQFAPLHAELPTLPEAFDYLVSGEFAPRPLQLALAEALSEVDGPALVIVEAPMGEGKTEAALYAYVQLQRAAQHRGLYIALPTQATGSAMYGRLVRFLAAQGAGRPVSIQLAHSGTQLHAKFQARRENTGVFYRQNVDADGADSVEAVRVEEWFTQRKRALLDEFGVGTVDQALLGVLDVPHQFVRLWGLGNRVVVLDEVHAYDAYTTTLIEALVAWLRALGSSVILMSATLPAESRRRLLRAWGAAEDLAAPAYPRYTLSTHSGEVRAETIASAAEPGENIRPPKRITLRPLESGVGAVAARAVQLSRSGGCVAVIVNTVKRAQDIQKEVVRLLEA